MFSATSNCLSALIFSITNAMVSDAFSSPDTARGHAIAKISKMKAGMIFLVILFGRFWVVFPLQEWVYCQSCHLANSVMELPDLSLMISKIQSVFM